MIYGKTIYRKMNKVFIYLICTALLFVASITSASAVSTGGIDKIYISNSSGDTGSKITVSVNAENMKNLGSLQLEIQYDKNVLLIENVTAGNATTGGMFTSNIRVKGVAIGIISTDGISGSGSIADITFNVVGPKGTSSPLTIDVMPPTDSRNNPIDVLSIGSAVFTVTGEGIVGTVSPTKIGMVPNPDNGSGGDTGVRYSSKNGESSSGNPSNVGTLSGKETPNVTGTKGFNISTATVVKETIVPEETIEQQKTVQSENTQKSPGLGMVALITILSLVYILGRRKRHKK